MLSKSGWILNTQITTRKNKEAIYPDTKDIYINEQKSKFYLQNGGLFLKQNSTVMPHCILREKNNSLALKVFKKALGICQ